MKKNNLSKDDILKKKFSTQLSGYNPTEVDEMLDKVIEDYDNNQEIIETLNRKIVEKNELIEFRDEEIQKKNLEVESLKNQLKESTKASNYEILKEIKKINETIKK